MSLKEYKTKRRFDETPEPDDRDLVPSSNESRFVIQCHDATRLHYDVRLQIGDVLKSWAVPKGPSLNPSDQQLAVFVEDHPLAYADFEGVIPPGNYGAGTVMIWDEGTYQERSFPEPGRAREVMENALNTGHITVVLKGKRVQGEFALIRIKQTKNWLLVKKWDQFASTKRQNWPMTSIRSGRDFSQLAASDQVWQGAGERTERQEKESPYPQPARASEIWESVAKASDGKMLMIPQKRERLQSHEHWIMQPNWAGKRYLLSFHHGRPKLVSKGGLDHTTRYKDLIRNLKGQLSQGILDCVLSPEIVDGLIVYDLVALDGKLWVHQTYENRQTALKPLIDSCSHLYFPREVRGQTELFRHYYMYGSYVAGVSHQVLLGFKEGHEEPELKVGSAAHQHDEPSTEASFILPEPQVYRGKARLSHGDRVYWPERRIKKAHVFDYYLQVAPYIIPHIKDRPLSLVRYPQGVMGQGFFQKDMTGFLPRYLETYPWRSSRSSKTINYALCQNLDSLLYLANLGTIEINPWMSTIHELDKPKLVYIDLDPHGRPFQDTYRVAELVKKLLDEIGVVSGIKTSGRSGLHIGIPLGQNHSYEQARDFCLSVCTLVEEQLPDICTLERNPNKRRGRLYLDCYQNARGQTIVAPYSLRPTPDASVSCPLLWDELVPDLRAGDLNLVSVRDRLKSRGEPWADLLSLANDLETARHRLKDVKP
ncbi:non-homologous end-joining DNA ligase [Pseudobacteriovorax antillogorgiicola]|uniref:Bifunctional non-homologous end joining protein LigD n=1 Tax=Pseudobacteriovorax antillogorgiicola TaxID=1513793 RepID=A0A1Y6BD37_9BACT|nr:non-homologous end-joining DNA ligase [Pseudobacteriovorax antillogorgiicola]TCS56456.1 bifunctional non-homologous end joining protein LigD [Pseudobacteriovorax antillogorgiicola]SMF05255.1 bifunctional non-homologous end joining protein LigD [Pseudobacteriovorax antillogorgiicola]